MDRWRRWSVLSIYVRFCQWSGFLPYRLEDGKMNRFLLVTVVKCVLIGVNLSLIVYGRECILYHCEGLGRAIDLIKLLDIILAEVILLVELFRTIPSVCAFWRTLYRVHVQLQGYGMVDHRRLHRLVQRYWSFLAYILVYICISELYNYYVTNSIQTKMFALYFYYLRTMMHLKEQQLLLPSLLLKFYLGALADLLQHHVQLLRYARMLKNTRYLEFLTGRIRHLKVLHGELFRASGQLNASYGWTYLVIYCKTFVQVLSNSYWVVFWVVNAQPGHAMRIFSRLFVRLWLLSIIFHTNNEVMKTGSSISDQLSTMDLRMQIENRSLYVMLDSFIQQVHSERINLTAADWIPLNYKPFFTIVITTCAYISLFIQQSPNNQRISVCLHRTDTC